MIIKIKYFGKEFELEINTDSKVEDIKQIIEEKECIPIRQQRLIFSSKPMLNEHDKAEWIENRTKNPDSNFLFEN